MAHIDGKIELLTTAGEPANENEQDWPDWLWNPKW